MCANSTAIVIAALFMASTALAQSRDEGAVHLGSHASSNKQEFRGVVEDRCIVCHERQMVVEAVREKELGTMQRHLREQGVDLGEGEKEVLGTFWGEPMRRKAEPAAEGPSINEADYYEFRQVLQSRCTGCHTLQRVERAMTRQQSYEAVIDKMLQRGAVLSEREIGILRRFWGKDDKPR